MYALYAPNKKERWKLERYVPSAEEIEFAKRFIGWNTIENGIQRVDACKTKDGQLLLVELEDLNPYLSLLELNKETVEIFINDLVDAINNL